MSARAAKALLLRREAKRSLEGCSSSLSGLCDTLGGPAAARFARLAAPAGSPFEARFARTLYLNLDGVRYSRAVARERMAVRSLARRRAPVAPPATTVPERWDRRRCHARPYSRLIDHRTHKAGYRDRNHLWSRYRIGKTGRPDRPRGAVRDVRIRRRGRQRAGRALSQTRCQARRHGSDGRL